MASIGRFIGNIISPAGQRLEGTANYAKFRRIRDVYESSVNAMQIRPNWESFLQISELMAAAPPIVVSEVILLMKQHLDATKNATVLMLILQLCDFLVKNGNPRMWRAFNNDGGEFMSSLSRTLRKFYDKKTSEVRPVVDFGLETIQAWGEGFLPHSKTYPHFIRVYHDMRKDGLRFKEQYDPSRVPIFTPEAGQSEMNTPDAVLAASIMGAGASASPSATRAGGGGGGGGAAGPGPVESQVCSALNSSLGLILDLMTASDSAHDFKEIASDMVQTMKAQSTELMQAIERSMDGDANTIAHLVAVHERVSEAMEVIDKISKGTMSFADARRRMQNIAPSPTPQGLSQHASAAAPVEALSPAGSGGGGDLDLLGLASPTAASTSAVTSVPVTIAQAVDGVSIASASALVNDDPLADLFGMPTTSAAAAAAAPAPAAPAPAPAAKAPAASTQGTNGPVIQWSNAPVPKPMKPIPKLMRPPSDGARKSFSIRPPPAAQAPAMMTATATATATASSSSSSSSGGPGQAVKAATHDDFDLLSMGAALPTTGPPAAVGDISAAPMGSAGMSTSMGSGTAAPPSAGSTSSADPMGFLSMAPTAASVPPQTSFMPQPQQQQQQQQPPPPPTSANPFDLF